MPYLLRRCTVTMGLMAKEDRSILGWFAVIVSMMALCLAFFGLRTESASGASGGSGGSAAASVDVTVTEFSFAPLMITLPVTGGTINISNTGTAVHTFSVPELGLAS